MTDDHRNRNKSQTGLVITALAVLGGIAGGYNAMVAPLTTRIQSIDAALVRVEAIIRQTVEDVDAKLRREATLIEEKSTIQFEELHRQVDLLRWELNRLRDAAGLPGGSAPGVPAGAGARPRENR
jgi:hypothetical protein